jgi:hypothetical protein
MQRSVMSAVGIGGVLVFLGFTLSQRAGLRVLWNTGWVALIAACLITLGMLVHRQRSQV